MPFNEFECLGVKDVQAKLPKIAGQFSGVLILAGTAKCVWDDLYHAGMAKNDDLHPHVMVLNDLILHYPGRIDHAYSNNHAYLPKWIEARRDQFKTRWGDPKHTHSNKVGGKHTWPWPGNGTSALGAVYTGIGLGYTDIRLCGIPLDNQEHYFEPSWMRSNFQHQIKSVGGDIKHWSWAARKIFQGRVTSYSGRTKKLLGAPT